MKNGTLRYGSVDVGFNVIDVSAGQLGLFAGYRHLHEIGRGYGCRQIATDSTCVPTVPTGYAVLTETETWRGGAIGLNTRIALADRWRLEVDAAYLPYVDRSSTDNHWLRADINPGPEDGRGWGTQIEAIVSYAVSDRLSVGAGGRYWYFSTTSDGAQFTGNAQPSPVKFATDRYGGFVQASYAFGDRPRRPAGAPREEAAATWTGVYAGGHLGAGWGHSRWADPFAAPVYGDRVTNGGALAGGQIGVNYQIGRLVLGAEARGSWANIEGTMTCFAGLASQADAGANCGSTFEALGTFTGRLGVAAGQTLLYAAGGAAVARERFELNTVAYGGQDSFSRTTKLGWTAGGGIEQALTPHWSVAADYKYIDLGASTLAFTVPAAYAAVASESVSRTVHLVTLGVNYRFNSTSPR
jgi:opacity protein-like surface antigen